MSAEKESSSLSNNCSLETYDTDQRCENCKKFDKSFDFILFQVKTQKMRAKRAFSTEFSSAAISNSISANMISANTISAITISAITISAISISANTISANTISATTISAQHDQCDYYQCEKLVRFEFDYIVRTRLVLTLQQTRITISAKNQCVLFALTDEFL